MTDPNCGQSLIELLIGTSMMMLTLVGSGWLLHAGWDRSRCAYFVFEAAHARRAERRLFQTPIGIPNGVRVSEDPSGQITGQADCNDASEGVRLPPLEPKRDTDAGEDTGNDHA